MRYNKTFTLSLVAVAMATAAGAQVIPLPDESIDTSIEINVSEQATVSVPATIVFNVADISVATASASASAIDVTNLVLASNTNQLKISVKASAATFSGSATPYNSSDVRWTGGSWTNAVPVASGGGGLTTSYKEVATCDDDVAACNTADAVFSLAANTSILTSDQQTLTMTWKFESIP